MNTYDQIKLHERLLDAYGATSRNANRFQDAINAVKWDNTFDADGETYFIKGGYTLTIENIHPFDENWKPCSHFSDGAVIEFK